jgi:drug/metabolite transporter (DMT)-like permease
MSRFTIPGMFQVALAAALWGTDALFRRGLALNLPPTTVVFAEHVILAVVTLPWLLGARPALARFGGRHWLAAILIGAGASAVATALFTAAFSYGNPTTPLLLQKLQPLVAVLGARLVLGERLLPRYWVYFALAVAGAYLVSFADPARVSVAAVAPALLAVGAAALWGLGTVLGRYLSSRVEFQHLTALRFAIGLPASALMVALFGQDPTAALQPSYILPLVLLSLVPGLLALLLYYRGLRRTPAAAATLAELAFPLTAILVNYLAFGTTLSPTQWIGALLLAGAVVAMGLASARGSESVGIRIERAVSKQQSAVSQPG